MTLAQMTSSMGQEETIQIIHVLSDTERESTGLLTHFMRSIYPNNQTKKTLQENWNSFKTRDSCVKTHLQVGEMTELLRALKTLAEDLSLVSSIYTR